MSRTLTFAHGESVLAIAKSHVQSGRTSRAIQTLRTALACEELDPVITIDSHLLAAQLLREREQFSAARKHLRTALRLDRENAALHYELGLVDQDDPYGCDRRAAARFRSAVAFSPDTAKYHAAFGLALVRLNRVRAGLRELQHAVELASADVDVLTVAVKGFCEADRPDLAKTHLEIAMFGQPHSAALRSLWNFTRFQSARVQQANRATQDDSDSPRALPFLRVVTEPVRERSTGGIVRADLPTRPAPHFHRLRAFRAEQG